MRIMLMLLFVILLFGCSSTAYSPPWIPSIDETVEDVDPVPVPVPVPTIPISTSVSSPIFFPRTYAGNMFDYDIDISIECYGVTNIYYTTDRSDPITSSTRQLYTDPIPLAGHKSYIYLDAIGERDGVYGNPWSTVYVVFYGYAGVTFEIGGIPTIGGTYTGTQNVTLIPDPPDADLYYMVTNGNYQFPDTLYTGIPIIITQDSTLYVRCVHPERDERDYGAMFIIN